MRLPDGERRKPAALGAIKGHVAAHALAMKKSRHVRESLRLLVDVDAIDRVEDGVQRWARLAPGAVVAPRIGGAL
jgi:hypothetical protein